MHHVDEENQQNGGSQDINDDDSSSIPEYHITVIFSKNEPTEVENHQILKSTEKIYRRYLQIFPSRNQFFKHLDTYQSKKSRRQAWKVKKTVKFGTKKIEKKAIEKEVIKTDYHATIENLPNGEGLFI